MRKSFIIIMIIVAMGMVGCSIRSPMQNFHPVEINELGKPDESAIVFFTPKNSLRRHVPIVEVEENGNLRFVTIIVAGTKYIHRTAPGKHLYFLSSMNSQSEMLEADMAAGKIYYAYVSQHPDALRFDPQHYTSAFHFGPVRNSSEKSLKKDLDSCRWFQNTHEAKAWFERNLPNLQMRSVEAHMRHQQTIARKVIAPEYGTTVPVR